MAFLSDPDVDQVDNEYICINEILCIPDDIWNAGKNVFVSMSILY